MMKTRRFCFSGKIKSFLWTITALKFYRQETCPELIFYFSLKCAFPASLLKTLFMQLPWAEHLLWTG